MKTQHNNLYTQTKRIGAKASAYIAPFPQYNIFTRWQNDGNKQIIGTIETSVEKKRTNSETFQNLDGQGHNHAITHHCQHTLHVGSPK